MRFPSTSPGRFSGGGGDSTDSDPGDDVDETDGFRDELGGDPAESGGTNTDPEPDPPDDRGGGSSSGGGLPGSIPDAPDTDATPDVPPEPAPDPEPEPEQGAPEPDPADEFGPELGGDPAESGGSNTGADPAPVDEPEPEPADAAPVDDAGPSDADPEPDPPGSPGDIDFRFSDQSDAVDADPDFRTDTAGRDVAEDLLAGGRNLGDRIGGGAADVIGADRADRAVLQSFASAGTTIPGSVAFIGADVADATRFVTEPARDAVEPGAQLDFGDLADIGTDTAVRTGEIGAAAGDAAIEGADTVLDIDFERRAEGEGAAISFTDDPEVRQQLAGELAFGAASLGAAGPASSATRGAVGAASRGARSVADAGSSGARGAADAIDFGDFVEDTRAAEQISRQRSPGDRDSGSTTIDAGDIEDPDDMTGEIARQTQEQTIFEQEQRFGDIERESVPEAPRDTTNVRDTGSDIDGGIGGRGSPEPADGVGSFADNFDAAIRASNTDPQLTDLRDTVDVTELDGATASGGGTGAAAGAGAGALGELDSVNDPTGIGDTDTLGGADVVDVSEITGAGTDTTGTDTVDPINDPTAISPGVEDQLAGGRLGGGTLPADAAGGGTDVGTLDETNDPTAIDPGTDTDTGADTDSGTDVFVEPGPATDTGTEPGTDTPPATDTDTDPAQTTPPRTDTGTGPIQDTPPVETPGRTPDPSRTPDPTPRPTPTPDTGRPRRPPELPDDDDEDRDELDFRELGVDEATFTNPTSGLDELDDELTEELDFDL